MPEERKNTSTCYQMAEKNLIGNVKETVANCDLLSVVMICLGGQDAEQ